MKSFLLFLLLLSLNQLKAEFALGSGYSSSMQGRTVPIIYMGIERNNLAITGSSVGVKNSLYYHSAWLMNVFYMVHPGTFWWGDAYFGLGWGFFGAEKGYRSSLESKVKKKFDVTTGPSFRALWNFAGPVFVGLESMFGFGNPFNHLLLSFRNDTNAILGVRF